MDPDPFDVTSVTPALYSLSGLPSMPTSLVLRSEYGDSDNLIGKEANEVVFENLLGDREISISAPVAYDNGVVEFYLYKSISSSDDVSFTGGVAVCNGVEYEF